MIKYLKIEWDVTAFFLIKELVKKNGENKKIYNIKWHLYQLSILLLVQGEYK